MGTISMHYNIKPKPIDVFKDDLGLEVLDHNITKIDGDIINGNQLDSYVIYSACKYKNDVLAFIGLIDYDLINKKVFCKIMDETVEIPNFALSVYDVIMGAEMMNLWDKHAKGLSWFRKYFPKEYMIILD